MNLRDFDYLVALAEFTHFRKAAERCFVSQPALSMQIKKLEQYLDVQLMERTNKSVQLTPVGRLLTIQAREILRQVATFKAIAQSARDPFGGEMTIGVIPTLAPYWLPQTAPSLPRQFPHLTIYWLEKQTAELIEKLKAGEIDAAVLALPIKETSLQIFPLFKEEFLLAVPTTHLFAKRKTIKLNALNHHQLLLLEEGHCLREQALAICQLAHAEEVHHFRATSLETLRYMVAAGNAITLMPKRACQKFPGITYVPFHHPRPNREIALLWRTGTARNKLLLALAKQFCLSGY